MHPPEAPPATKPPAYTLPLYAFAVWLPCAALVGWLGYHGATGDSAYRSGYVIGSIVATFFLPMIISWITWRACGRRGRAHAIVFLVLVVLVALGQVNQRLHNSAERAAVARFDQESKKAQADMRTLLASEKGLAPEQAAKVLDQAKTSLKNLGDNTQGDARGEALAGQAFLAVAQEAQRRHLTAIAGLHIDTFFEMESVASAELRAPRAAAVAEFRAACAGLRSFIEQGATSFENELQKQHVSPQGIRQSLVGFHESASPQRPILLQIREKDERLAQAMEDFLKFAEKYEGRWQRNPESKAIQFADDEAVKEFNDLIALVNRTGREQVALQQQLGRLGTK
jgi:hypothetical protein